jgi:hypothetical protein
MILLMVGGIIKIFELLIPSREWFIICLIRVVLKKYLKNVMTWANWYANFIINFDLDLVLKREDERFVSVPFRLSLVSEKHYVFYLVPKHLKSSFEFSFPNFRIRGLGHCRLSRQRVQLWRRVNLFKTYFIVTFQKKRFW